MWTYGLQLGGNAKKVEYQQNSNFPKYSASKIIKCSSLRFHHRLLSHPNPLARNLSTQTIPGNPPRRLNVNGAVICLLHKTRSK